MKALHESIGFQNETQKKMKKKKTHDRREIKTGNWLQEYRRSVKDRRHVEDRHRRNNLQLMGIKKKKNEVETETWEECGKKMKVFLQGKLDLETEKIINKRVHRIGKKEEKKKGRS